MKKDFSKEYIESFEYYINKAKLLVEAPSGDLDLQEPADGTKKIPYKLNVYGQTILGDFELTTVPPVMKQSLYAQQKLTPNSVIEVTDEAGKTLFFHVGTNVINLLITDILETVQAKKIKLSSGQVEFTSDKIESLKVVNYSGKPIKVVDEVEFQLVEDNPSKGLSQFRTLPNGNFEMLVNYVIK